MLKRLRTAFAAFVTCVLLVSWTLEHSYFVNSQESNTSDICVMFWNVSSCDLGWTGVVTTLKHRNPDVIGLTEIGGGDLSDIQRWQEAFPDYELTDAYGGMLLLSKSPIMAINNGRLDDGGHYKHVSIETASGRLHAVVVDIRSDPLMSRQQPLAELVEVTTDYGSEPVVVMGDFNTPADSVHFDTLRHSFENAFEVRGNGYAPTWPLPFPIMQLDHIWTNRQTNVSRCESDWTSSSDHRPVAAWLATRY